MNRLVIRPEPEQTSAGASQRIRGFRGHWPPLFCDAYMHCCRVFKIIIHRRNKLNTIQKQNKIFHFVDFLIIKPDVGVQSASSIKVKTFIFLFA